MLYYNFCRCIPCKCIENTSDRYQLVFFFSFSLSFGPNFHIQSHLERNRRLGSLGALLLIQWMGWKREEKSVEQEMSNRKIGCALAWLVTQTLTWLLVEKSFWLLKWITFNLPIVMKNCRQNFLPISIQCCVFVATSMSQSFIFNQFPWFLGLIRVFLIAKTHGGNELDKIWTKMKQSSMTHNVCLVAFFY